MPRPRREAILRPKGRHSSRSTTTVDTPSDRAVTDTPRREAWFTAGALALLCLAAYSNSFTTGFPLDNRQLILRDPRVHALTSENLSLIANRTYWWPYGESGLYRPLTTLTYLFNYVVLGNGAEAAGYHWFNLVVHVVNVLLVWRIAGRVMRDGWIATVTAALWAVLPISTEAVTNIVGRADLLAATGSLCAVALYLSAREMPSGAGLVRLAGLALAILAGVLAKESAVAVVGVLILIEAIWWRPHGSGRRLAATAAILALPIAAWLVHRANVLAAGGSPEFPFTDNPIVGAGFWQGRLTALLVTWRYLALIAWPATLSADYSYAQIPLAGGHVGEWLACVALVGAVAAALWLARANRPVLFFSGFALLTFLPASNLLFPTGTIMAERLLYLPSAGIAAVVAIAMKTIATSRVKLRAITIVVALLVTAGGARTWARNSDWTDDVTLWSATVVASPSSAKAHRALAEALYDADPAHRNIDEVIVEAERSVALLESLPDERNTFQAFRQAGAYYLDKANALDPATDEARLRELYARALARLDRAVTIAQRGAQQYAGASLEPEGDAERLRAAALLGLGDPVRASAAARRSLALSPLNPLAYHLAASALLAMNQREQALVTLLAGGIVSNDRTLGQQAMSLYDEELDPDGCAVSGAGAGAMLNPRCPVVQRHSCMAIAAAYQILKKAGQAARAEALRATAVDTVACPLGLLDQPNLVVP